MPQNETINNLVDPKVYDELDKLLDKLLINSSEVEKFNVALGNSKGFNAINTNSKKVNDALKQLVDTQNRVAQTQERLTQNRLDTTLDRQATAATKLAAKVAAANDPFNQLTASLKQAEQNALSMGATFGATSPQFLEASNSVKILRDQVDSLEQPLGRFQRNVGNYSSAFTGYANTLRGLRGPTKLLGEALGLGAQEADQFRLILEHSFQGIAAFFRGKEAKAAASAEAAVATSAETAAETVQTAAQYTNTVSTEANTVATEGAAVAETELAVATTGASTAMTIFRYALIGIGIGVLLGVIGFAIAAYRAYKKSAEEAAESQKIFNETSAAADVDAGKQITNLKLLYGAATDVTNSYKDRLKAAKELKTEFPEQFANDTALTILNGKQSESLQQLTADIIKNAKAKAAASKIAELAAKQLDLDYQRDKINIAKANQLNRVSGPTTGMNLGAGSSSTISVELQKTNIKAQADLAQKDVKDKQGILQNQIDFLTKYGGGANKIAKALVDLPKDKKEKKEKAERDPAIDQAALLTKQIEAEKQRNELVQQNDKSTFDERLKSVQDFETKSEDLINKRTAVELSKAKLTEEQKKIIRQESANAITAIELEAQKERKKLSEDELKNLEITYKAQIDLAKKHDVDLLNDLKESSAKKLSQIEKDKNHALEVALDQFASGKIDEKQYSQQNTQIEADALDNRTKEQIAYYQKIIGLKTKAGQDATADQIKLDEIEAQANKNLYDIKKKNLEDYKSALKQLKDLEKQLGNALFDFGKELGDNTFTKRLNDIQKQKDAITDLTAVQIAAENRSLDSAQQKADKIAVINAQAKAKQDQLDKETRKVNHDQAKFDKITDLAKAAGAIAVAEVQALTYLSNPFTAPLYPGIAAFIGTIGALQLASIAAREIPAYFTGTPSSKAGPAWVGEKGVELAIEPGGKKWLTPEVPTLMNLKGGTKIINNKELMQSMARPPQFQNITHDIDIKELILEQRANNRELKAVKEAILAGQRQPPRRGVNYNDSRFNAYYEGLKK